MMAQAMAQPCVPPTQMRGRTTGCLTNRQTHTPWVSNKASLAARADGRGKGRGAKSDTSRTRGEGLRGRATEDSGAARTGVTVTAISEPAVTNAEVASEAAPASSDMDTMRANVQAVPRTKREPISIDQLQAVVLAGGPSTGNPLTKFEARASLKFAASYRLIDFPMGNIINSGMKRAFVLTQFNSYTLNQHVQAAYPPEVFGFGSTGYVDVLPSFQTVDEKEWSVGSADSVRRHYKAGSLRGPSFSQEPEAYLILSGEALYRMDYSAMLKTHNDSGADITIATARRRLGDLDASNVGVCAVAPNADGNFAGGDVYRFVEQPDLEALKEMAVCDEMDTKLADCDVHVNMGVYIFSKKAMDELLGVMEMCTERLDFGKDIIPMAIRAGHATVAHQHEGYWQPIRNLREWYDANLALCPKEGSSEEEGPSSSLGKNFSATSMIDHEFPLHTVPRCLPPARFRGDCRCEQSIVSEGVVVGDRAVVTKSVVGPCVVLGEDVQVNETIFIGHQETGYLHGDGEADVGAGSVLRNCVVHSDVVIGPNCVLTNEQGVKDHNGVDVQSGLGYMIQDGIIVFMPGTTIEAGTVI